MDPAAFYHLDRDAILALPRAEALKLLDEIRLDVTRATGAERARIVADEVAEQAAAHGERGAQRRAAAALDMKPARLGQLYNTKETPMAPRPTTSYGTWNNRCEPYSANLATTVVESLTDFAGDYDVDALTRDYRDAINAALPPEVALAGDEFLGPHQPDEDEWDGYPVGEDGRLDIKAIVSTVDFWEIAARHDKTT